MRSNLERLVFHHAHVGLPSHLGDLHHLPGGRGYGHGVVLSRFLRTVDDEAGRLVDSSHLDPVSGNHYSAGARSGTDASVHPRGTGKKE